MSEKWTYLELAKRILEEEKKPLSSSEIWKIAVDKQYNKRLGSIGKTPWSSLSTTLYIDSKLNKNTVLSTVGSRPVRYYVKTLMSESEAEKLVESIEPLAEKKTKYTERDLHQLLSYYAYTQLKVHTKTIQHTKSKKEFGEWVHPDMVGCHFSIDEWRPEVVDFGKATGNVLVKLFSFEIKKEVNFDSLRESFFQTVSNSSWANESYLVVASLSEEEGFPEELRRLSSSFGVGVIELDTEDPDATKIALPARSKEYLDWDTINKLADMNPDFRETLKRIKNDVTSGEIVEEKYDKVPTKEELGKIFGVTIH